jgi:hypothetical protein
VQAMVNFQTRSDSLLCASRKVFRSHS